MSQESPMVWKPTEEMKSRSNMKAFMDWLAERGWVFPNYETLWAWSVSQNEAFWELLAQYFEIRFHQPPSVILKGSQMPAFQWFEGATLNYAEHLLRHASDTQPALLFSSEQQALQEWSWEEVITQAAALQDYLLETVLEAGDRVAAYLPNIPQASIALIATLASGGIWSSCSPDFGTQAVIDRLSQIEPKVLIAADGYSYGGKSFDRLEELRQIKKALPTLQTLILVPYLNAQPKFEEAVLWDTIRKRKKSTLHFKPLPFDHPIWILFSSGTTGIPKAITHSHGGVLLEHYKYLSLHNDVKPGEKFFWYSTTGWMMWNFLHASWLAGATVVLYDGSPVWPDANALWKLAADAGIHHFGTSAPFLVTCSKEGLQPGKQFELADLRSIGSTGSPLPPEIFSYGQESIGKHIWLCSMSGGTDVCTAFVGSNPLLPVYEGEIQCRALGCALLALDEQGLPARNEVGEMVITRPMPSMPIYFWNDPGGQKYQASYFEEYKGYWRHGDWVMITKRGTVIIYGRSDATLNRQGIRIGTAEIYRAVEQIEGISDSLVIHLESLHGKEYMPLFVVMKKGVSLDDLIKKQIKERLKKDYSPRHVPDDIIEVSDIPYTVSGKKMETPVKKILQGKAVEQVINLGSVRNPESLNRFIELAEQWK